jgi:hypothetical protein
MKVFVIFLSYKLRIVILKPCLIFNNWRLFWFQRNYYVSNDKKSGFRNRPICLFSYFLGSSRLEVVLLNVSLQSCLFLVYGKTEQLSQYSLPVFQSWQGRLQRLPSPPQMSTWNPFPGIKVAGALLSGAEIKTARSHRANLLGGMID